MNAREEMYAVIKDSWEWLRDTGLDMKLRYDLHWLRVLPEEQRQYKQAILFSPTDKPLNETVKTYKDYLVANYPLDRLAWVVQFSEFFFDMGKLPPFYPSWWSLYRTILGEPPEGLYLPDGTNWYWVVRRHYRQFDKQYVKDICRSFFATHPQAKEQMYHLHIPTGFREIAQQLRPDELYQYWKEHYMKEMFSRPPQGTFATTGYSESKRYADD